MSICFFVKLIEHDSFNKYASSGPQLLMKFLCIVKCLYVEI